MGYETTVIPRTPPPRGSIDAASESTTSSAPHAHALPSYTFQFPVPAVLAASPASLPPSLLSAALTLVPSGVTQAFCVAVLLLPLSVGAPGCPLCAPKPSLLTNAGRIFRPYFEA